MKHGADPVEQDVEELTGVLMDALVVLCMLMDLLVVFGSNTAGMMRHPAQGVCAACCCVQQASLARAMATHQVCSRCCL